MSNKKIVLVCFLMVCILFKGCISSPPTAADMKNCLLNNKDCFEKVAKWLSGLEYDSVSVRGNDGTCFYEFATHEVPTEIQSSIDYLWQLGCIRIFKEPVNANHTIWFEMWSSDIRSRDCGIACTDDGTGTPEATFQIHSEEIDSGWFYYYSDYETYRANPR